MRLCLQPIVCLPRGVPFLAFCALRLAQNTQKYLHIGGTGWESMDDALHNTNIRNTETILVKMLLRETRMNKLQIHIAPRSWFLEGWWGRAKRLELVAFC